MATAQQRRYGPKPFFSDDAEPQQQLLGFQQVADMATPEQPDVEMEQQELVAPEAAPEQPMPQQAAMEEQQLPTDTELSGRVALAKSLMEKGADTSETHSPWESVGRFAQTISGAYLQNKANKDLAAKEKADQKAWGEALGGYGDDDPVIDRMLKSTNEKVVAHGLALKAKVIEERLKRSGKFDPSEAPKQNTYNKGDQEVTEEWDARSGKWVEKATAPRYKPGTSGVGGGAGGANL